METDQITNLLRTD